MTCLKDISFHNKDEDYAKSMTNDMELSSRLVVVQTATVPGQRKSIMFGYKLTHKFCTALFLSEYHWAIGDWRWPQIAVLALQMTFGIGPPDSHLAENTFRKWADSPFYSCFPAGGADNAISSTQTSAASPPAMAGVVPREHEGGRGGEPWPIE